MRFAPGLVETILNEVADQSGCLPLPQFPPHPPVGRATPHQPDLERISAVRRVLPSYADGVINVLPVTERIRTRRILVQLVRSPQQDESATC